MNGAEFSSVLCEWCCRTVRAELVRGYKEVHPEYTGLRSNEALGRRDKCVFLRSSQPHLEDGRVGSKHLLNALPVTSSCEHGLVVERVECVSDCTFGWSNTPLSVDGLHPEALDRS